MKRFSKKLMALLLILAMLMPTESIIFAADAEIYSGTCGDNGDNITWSLDTSTGTLTISGEGAMMNYASAEAPWYSNRESVKSVIINAGVTSIGNCAFSYCSKLSTIIIPDSVTSIGNSAFYYCSKLSTIIIPDSVTSIGNRAFYECSALTSVDIPESLTTIANSTFAYCKKLTSIDIPEGVTSIGDSAFYYCSALTSIDIPEGVTSIGDSAFSYCSKLSTVIIPDSVTTINSKAFYECTNISNLMLGKNLKTVGTRAFGGYDSGWNHLLNIKNVYYSGNIEDWCNITFEMSESGAFTGSLPSCPAITNFYINGKIVKDLVIPEGVTTIKKGAFYSVKSITSITIPKSVKSIESNAFNSTTPKTVYYEGTVADWCNISISGSITTYHSYVGANPVKSSTDFYINGEKVEDLVIPDGTTTIGTMTFCNVDCIKTIYIPKSVKKINNLAFYGCNLTDICYEGSQTDWKAITISSNNDILTSAKIHYEEDVNKFPYFDSDGDGLPDKWEIEGVDTDGDGTIDVDLPAMGADPHKPDIFIEVDWMVKPKPEGFSWGKSGRNLKPSKNAMRMVYDAFKSHGINLHVDCGPDSTDFVTGKKWGELSGGNEINYIQDFNLNSDWLHTTIENFDEDRYTVFRYCIFLNQYDGGTSSGKALGIPGQFFIVANQDWVYNGGDISVAGTFMHELGHTLGLRHGGCDDEHYKPNYLSIMNYAFQNTGLAGTEGINYSDYALPDIDESAINETIGIDPEGLTAGTGLKTTLFYKTDLKRQTGTISKASIDFNRNNKIDEEVYSLNINVGGHVFDPVISVLKGFNDWKNLVYTGGDIGELTDINMGESLSINIDIDNLTTEKTLEEALRTSTLANDGTGFAEPVATMIVKDIENQKLYFDVSNMGATDATFTINIKCDELFDEFNEDVFVKGSIEQIEKTRISIPADSAVDAGEYTVTCTISHPDTEDVELSYTITVYAPTEEELNQAKEELDDGNTYEDSDIINEIKNVLKQTVGYEEKDTDNDDDDNNNINCSHLCHSTNGFMQFIWKIAKFFYRLFGLNQYCECGTSHW